MILGNPNGSNHRLIITLRANLYRDNNRLDVKKIQSTLRWLTNELVNINEREWELHFATFRVNIPTSNWDIYLKLLKNGNSLQSIKAKREADDFRSPKKLTYRSKSMWITIKEYNEKGLDISLSILYRKIQQLIKNEKFSITDSTLSGLSGQLEVLEMELWNYYMNRIAGNSDYYSYKRAETIINNAKKKKITREKLESTLKGVAIYKGIEEFIKHAAENKAGIPQDPIMDNINSEEVARKYLLMLERELKINPVVISRSYAMERKVDWLPNLLSKIKERVPQYDMPQIIKAEIVNDVEDDIPVFEAVLLPSDDEDDWDF